MLIKQTDYLFMMERKNILKAFKKLKDFFSNGFESRYIESSNVINSKSFEEAMVYCRWNVYTNADEDIYAINFSGNVLGDDLKIFEVIALYITSGSYIEMKNKNNLLWRWTFNGRDVKEKFAKIIWE